ncbi:hypothetical protein SCATT_43410 [Streptantibioticus cattleyicolor NRRL 8057 = DSM 46488]|uniref:Uncharacterized protein n=1 Tax=Streptantibioticus cattleyicolor (strain ATCC 35852 / DSM 46488 / JCM 4925 / NBRC 14057 / NRRL 8057) TaxID=1003195 RepID=G8WT06_STREN|nr:hypothetical protein SCATT_43410 [Streptantibioticus cattleyicolor NRRL 8057 = DSM 46488]
MGSAPFVAGDPAVVPAVEGALEGFGGVLAGGLIHGALQPGGR